MLKKLKLRIALWVLNQKDFGNVSAIRDEAIFAHKIADILRLEYIALVKLSRSLNEQIERAEEIYKIAVDEKWHDGKINAMAKNLESKQMMAKKYSKKLFAFHGMFEAYEIKRVTEEELK